MLLVLSLSSLYLFARFLGLCNEFGIFLIHGVENVPIRCELFEGGSTQDNIKEGIATGTIHAARTRSQLFLITLDLLGFFLNLSFSFSYFFLSFGTLFLRFVIIA